MGGFGNFLDKWGGRFSTGATFWALVPPGVLAVVGAYLSTSVTWINQWGPWGWFMAGLSAFALSAFSFAAMARTRLWRLDSVRVARIEGDSSQFDPMATVYENKRLYLRDLAPLGRKMIVRKKFINCEIIGPGTAIIGLRSSDNVPFGTMRDCHTFEVDCIEIDPKVASQLAIGFTDCDFDGCRFYHMTLLFTARGNPNLHWLTPDFTQPRMLEDHRQDIENDATA